MIVIVRVEVDDEQRRAIRARIGKPGLATRREVASLVDVCVSHDLGYAVDEMRANDGDRARARASASRARSSVSGKPLVVGDESRHERAVRVMATGWCPWPYLGATAPGDTGLDLKAECRCGKRVRVTARGLLSHHKMLRLVSKDLIMPPIGDRRHDDAT